jgi:hypothetical protein
MKQLVIKVDIGLLETGINLGDAIQAIQTTLEPIKLKAFAEDAISTTSGEIIDEVNGDDLLGFWEINNRV